MIFYFTNDKVFYCCCYNNHSFTRHHNHFLRVTNLPPMPLSVNSTSTGFHTPSILPGSATLLPTKSVSSLVAATPSVSSRTDTCNLFLLLLHPWGDTKPSGVTSCLYSKLNCKGKVMGPEMRFVSTGGGLLFNILDWIIFVSIDNNDV